MSVQYEKIGFEQFLPIANSCSVFFKFYGEKKVVSSAKSPNNSLKHALQSMAHDGKKGKITVTTLIKEKHFVVLMGLGNKEKYDIEIFRRAYSEALTYAKTLKVYEISIFPPCVKDENEIFEIPYISELTLYDYSEFKSDFEKPTIRKIKIVTKENIKYETKLSVLLADATNFTRNIGNLPPSFGTPSFIEKIDRNIKKVSIRVLDREDFIKMGMGGIEAVSRAAREPAKLLILEYKGSNEKPILIVGKGITFDSGGISIKPWQNMDEMKFDKCGAATVIGIMKLVSSLNMKYHVVGITPLTENMPGGNAYKPGDILRHYNGLTSEIISTDAEGRLVLADALSYGISKFDPTHVIDFATLTGASIVALGKYKAGLFTNNDQIKNAILDASTKTWEKLWPLPLDEEYKEQIKSEIADIKNSGGNWGGSSTAAAFLSCFVDERPWAHIDFPGVAYVWGNDKRLGYLPYGSTGYGVRLIYEFLVGLK